MSQTPKVVVRIKGERGHYNLFGRTALQFRVWWENSPSLDASGKEQKVEFYNGIAGHRGHTFSLIPGNSKGGYKRSALILSYQ